MEELAGRDRPTTRHGRSPGRASWVIPEGLVQDPIWNVLCTTFEIGVRPPAGIASGAVPRTA